MVRIGENADWGELFTRSAVAMGSERGRWFHFRVARAPMRSLSQSRPPIVVGGSDMATSHDVALVISDLGSGGAQRVVTQLAAAWDEVGRKVAIITFVDRDADFFRLPPNVTRFCIGGHGTSCSLVAGVLANLSRVLRLRRALRQANAPVVLAFMTQTAVITVLAAVALDTRVIACERNDPSRQSFGVIWNSLRRLVYPHALKVTANSHGALKWLSRFVPRHKLAYVPNPLSPSVSNERLNLGAPTIVAVGRLHHQKGFDVLLHAFATFRSTHSGWRLAIMGEGAERHKLLSLAAYLGIADDVDWMGRRADPYPLLRAAQIFVLPSRYEGMPNALMEAMACGLPCVVSDASPGPLELIDDGVSGLIVTAEDAASVAAALDRLAVDSELCSRLGEAAKTCVARYALPVVLSEWNSLVCTNASSGSS